MTTQNVMIRFMDNAHPTRLRRVWRVERENLSMLVFITPDSSKRYEYPLANVRSVEATNVY